jgi:DNA-binding transcriptional regulator YiaG
MECERDKLKSDISEAHQRSTMLAQEVDEQNSRLERNTQALLQKTESKYMDQIHQLQRRFNVEKESFQHSLNAVESQLNNYKDEETRLKHQITSLSQV